MSHLGLWVKPLLCLREKAGEGGDKGLSDERFDPTPVVAVLSLLLCVVHTLVRVSVALLNTTAESFLGRKGFVLAYN